MSNLSGFELTGGFDSGSSSGGGGDSAPSPMTLLSVGEILTEAPVTSKEWSFSAFPTYNAFVIRFLGSYGALIASGDMNRTACKGSFYDDLTGAYVSTINYAYALTSVTTSYTVSRQKLKSSWDSILNFYTQGQTAATPEPKHCPIDICLSGFNTDEGLALIHTPQFNSPDNLGSTVDQIAYGYDGSYLVAGGTVKPTKFKLEATSALHGFVGKWQLWGVNNDLSV